ncbi:fungal hydrophobin [Agrocybe pediades]|nr:fungal hydrophobin [Agrocybe pediades]
MHAKFTSISAFVTLATASSASNPLESIPASQCNSGSLLCCNSTQLASSPSSTLLGLFGVLGINPASVSGLVGVTCTPLTVVGVGGNSCAAQPVCCTNNSFNGIVALGCTPVNLNL